MFIVNWLFDKLGYMPKIRVEATWPFPAEAQAEEKPVVKKATTRKPKAAVIAKSTRAKKAK